MPSTGFFLAAEDVSVDQQTNRLSIFNVIEDAPLGDEGQGVLSATLVCLLNIEEDEIGQEFDYSFIVCRPNGEEDHFDGFQFEPKQNRHRVFTRLGNIPLTESGELTFRAFLNGEFLDSHTVHVEGADTDEEETQVQEATEVD